MKTIIKWSGDKSKNVSHILPYIPEFSGRYIEPFVGSGALFLKLEPKKWIISDLNKDYINLYKQVRDNPKDFISKLKRFDKKFTPMDKEEKVDYCRKLLNTMDSMDYSLHRAFLFTSMKYCAYMGNIIIDDEFKIRRLDINIRKDNYTFLQKEYYDKILDTSEYLDSKYGKIYDDKEPKSVIRMAKDGDFVFLDPPYVEKDELEMMLIELKKLDNNYVKWIMTPTDTEEVRHVFRKYTIIEFPDSSDELMIMNF